MKVLTRLVAVQRKVVSNQNYGNLNGSVNGKGRVISDQPTLWLQPQRRVYRKEVYQQSLTFTTTH